MPIVRTVLTKTIKPLNKAYLLQKGSIRMSSVNYGLSKASSKPVPIQNGSTPHKQINAWQQPGPAAYDFRSDTITTPTAAMLEAITNTTLMDDVFLEDPTTTDLEASMAALAGHEAGLLVMSGTMGNQISLRSHLSAPPHSVVCDYRSHIFTSEAGGAATLSNALLIPIRPKNNHHITLEDIKSHAILHDDIHGCPTRVISLENTLHGTILPLDEVKRISSFAREHGIKMHLDGARIWDAVAASTPDQPTGSLPDFTTLFDSVSMCFSKGLGAPIGSMIVGDKSFITKSRHVRKMIGGGIRQAGVISAAARVAVEEGFGHGPNGEGGKLRECHARAKRLAQVWQEKGGELTHPVETNMVWLDLEQTGWTDLEFVELAAKKGVKVLGPRIVVHYQLTEEAIEILVGLMDEVLQRKKQNGSMKEVNGNH